MCLLLHTAVESVGVPRRVLGAPPLRYQQYIKILGGSLHSPYRGAATPQVVYLGVTRQNVTDTHAHHHQDIAPEPCDHINTVC